MSVLRLEAARKSFGGLVAVDGVDLDLAHGEVHALIGPNGAGKTTLVNLISGELALDAGRLTLGTTDATRLSAAARSRLGLGRSFQTPRLFASMTVQEHVLMGVLAARRLGWGLLRDPARDPAVLDASRAALGRVGLTDLEAHPVASLAHGQKRRVELATILVSRPGILLLDEPLAGMGAEESAALTRLLAGLRREHAILLIEHDMDAVWALADRLSVLVEGRLVATGPPEEVRRDPIVRAAYLGDAPAHA
jgi:branched-chain amino acid transport system ATP-binding protein